MYGGLSRPTALDSDSPFAIASHALNDKSTPTAPTLKIPTRRAPPAAPSPAQPRTQSPHPPHPAQQGPPPPPPSSSSQGNAVQGDWRHHQNPGPGPMQSPGGGSGGYGLREGARDAYMGAGAYDARTGRYGPSATPAFPPQHQQHQQHGHPHQQQQQPQPQSHPQSAGQQYGSPQSSSRQPGYAQPYPPQGYPQQQQAQRPTTSQSAQSPTGPYPLVDRPARSPAPGQQGPSSHLQHQQQQQQQHQQGQPYPYSSSPANTTYAPSPAQLSVTGSTASPGYYGPTSPGAVQAAGAGNNSMGMGGGGMTGGQPTVVNPNQLSTRPQGQGGPRRSDSRDSATGQELWEMFSSMDLRRTGQLGNKEVMELLSRDSRWRITPREDCVKMLMSIFDSDRSGFISFSEFEGLWAYIKDWHKIFLRFDRDNSGTIDRGELDQALQSFGYPLPRDLVRKLEKRFAPPKDSGGSVPRGITFDRFLMACVTVKHFTEAFRRRDARNEGKLTIDYNTFMDLVIDAPV